MTVLIKLELNDKYKSATSGAMPSTGTGLKVLSILQNHYVERMGKGLVVNMPYVSLPLS
jgi:hypothetical protein